MENLKPGSERPKVAGRGLSPPSGPNQDTTPSRSSSPMRPISNEMQFGNCTLWPSGEAEVVGSGLGHSLVSIPHNRPLEKTEEDGRVDLGG